MNVTLLTDMSTNEDYLIADDSDKNSLSSVSIVSELFSDNESRSCLKKTEIHYLFSDIFVHIQSLYKISVSLWCSTVHNEYIHSVLKNANVSYFILWDQTHVKNKF